ncbi:MAG: 50S ribosomal protein L23 [Anaerolineales bacterium]|nr:50S ribosomal protein L23 [Anaerolineales bacterium]
MLTVYDVLRRPVETEKSRYQQTKLHQYVFAVHPRATKTQVKEAVETLFDVEVIKVNVVVVPPKMGRRGRTRRIVQRKPEYKKAIVTIRADQTIDLFEGVK